MKVKFDTTLKKVKDGIMGNTLWNKIVEFVKKHRLILSGIFFVAVTLAMILVAVLVRNEFVVPVCVLVIVETLMAVLLYRTELWIHGVLLLAQLLVGEFIDRLPLTGICVVVYLAALFTLHFGFKKKSNE